MPYILAFNWEQEVHTHCDLTIQYLKNLLKSNITRILTLYSIFYFLLKLYALINSEKEIGHNFYSYCLLPPIKSRYMTRVLLFELQLLFSFSKMPYGIALYTPKRNIPFCGFAIFALIDKK